MNRKEILTKNLDKKERIEEIDLLRGIPIFLVVLYHFCWSFYEIVYLFSNTQEMFLKYPNIRDFTFFLSDRILGGNSTLIQTFIVPLVGGLFIFVAGISCVFSKNNWKRALLLIGCAGIISLGTFLISYLIEDDCFIDWGVLHLMAFSVTLYALIQTICHLFHKKVSPYLCLSIAGIIFLVSIYLNAGYHFDGTTFEPWYTKLVYGLPMKRYDHSFSNFFLEALGKYAGTIDWWPILPYTGVFFFGAFFGILLYGEKRKSHVPFLRSLYVFRPICFIGRHTLYVYIFHQPVIILVLFLVFFSMGFRL